MGAFLAAYGAAAAFLVLIIGLPYIYFSLSSDAHREQSDTIQALIKDGIVDSQEEIDAYVSKSEKMLFLFELDWWIVLALALLLSSILGAGETIHSVGNSNETAFIKDAMKVYTILVALSIVFRLAWIRLALIRASSEFRINVMREFTKRKALPKKVGKVKLCRVRNRCFRGPSKLNGLSYPNNV